MKTLKLLSMSLLFSFNLISCEQSDLFVNELEVSTSNETYESIAFEAIEFTSNPDSLLSNEEMGLYLMREEEKMAMDIYAYFYEKYQIPIFNNIAKSESKHTSAVLRLINYFGLKDPALEPTAEYSNEEIQHLYTKLTSEANTIEEALSTGAFIEEYDIADLKKLIAETQNADIKLVYANLLRGSENHIKAFAKQLKFRGIEYVPQILSQEEYNSIINE
ncbi:MAG: DUF2202 domain-containing protein [Paludibacter sp.]|nr:DUF2202 domain-containing protein [Paludibacter sp.]